MATFGLSSLVLSTGANASSNKSAYPIGIKICGGSTCSNPDLYRSGNASSPRMENVRIDRGPELDDDIETKDVGGVIYVVPGTGGISTLESPTSGGNWWLFPEADPNKIPAGLCVVHNKKNHWAWEPKMEMTLDAYKVLLISSHVYFVKQ